VPYHEAGNWNGAGPPIRDLLHRSVNVMHDLTTDLRSLPEEYQLVIRLAEERYKIAVTPLQVLVGGWSGAAVHLVSVSQHETKRVEHCILKNGPQGNALMPFTARWRQPHGMLRLCMGIINWT
jgi:hypothetical protein